MDGNRPAFLQWLQLIVIAHLCTYFLHMPQPLALDSEIIPLLVYKDASSQESSASRQSTQVQSEDEVTYLFHLRCHFSCHCII